MKHKTISNMSKRRLKLLSVFLYFSTALALTVLLIGLYLQNKLIIYGVSVPTLLYAVAIYFLKTKPKISRFIYALTYVVAVFICSSLFGRSASVEIYYTFYYLLIFIIFSYRREKLQVILFTFLATISWILLIYFDFNIFNYNSLSEYEATTYLYPFIFIGNFALILITLIQFSYENAKMFKKQQENKNKAIALLNLKTTFLNAIDEGTRAPLNAIIGLTYLLNDEQPREDQKDIIASLQSSSKNLLELLNNILNISKSEKNNLTINRKPTSLTSLYNEIKNIYLPNCKEKNIDFIVKVDPNFPIITLDKLRYTQVINNLISNALKFTNTGSITAEIVTKEENKNNITFTTIISDSGIGIPDDKIDVIWEKFTQATSKTTKLYGGTGLGLSIVKNIVTTMGTTIQLNSELNKGSSFYFDLTVDKAIVNPLETDSILIEKKLENKKILITDDNKINILVLKQILKKRKAIIHEVTNGKEAVDVVKKETFDLILMDLNMPIMDGYDSIKEIRKFNNYTPIVIITANNTVNFKNLKDSNISGIISQPFEEDELLKVSSKLI